MPTPQCSDRFSLMQPEPSQPRVHPNDLGSRQNRASPAHNKSRARNGRSQNFPDMPI
jgi:hypothetical protein